MFVSCATLTQSSFELYTSAWSSVGTYVCSKLSQRTLVRRMPEQLNAGAGDSFIVYSLSCFLLCCSGQPWTHSVQKEDEVLQRQFTTSIANKRSWYRTRTAPLLHLALVRHCLSGMWRQLAVLFCLTLQTVCNFTTSVAMPISTPLCIIKYTCICTHIRIRSYACRR